MAISLTAIGAFVKTASKVFKDANKIELQNTLLEIQSQLIDLSTENVRLHSENLSLKNKLAIKGALSFKDNNLYIVDRRGKVIDGPFCSPCYEHNEKLIHLHFAKSSGRSHCPVCRIFGGEK